MGGSEVPSSGLRPPSPARGEGQTGADLPFSPFGRTWPEGSDEGTPSPAGTLLRQRMSAFVHLLRDNGFVVGVAEAHDALAVIADGTLLKAHLLRSALKQLFASRQADWMLFDKLFDTFWLERNMRSTTRLIGNSPHAPVKKGGAGQSDPGADGAPDRTERKTEDGAGNPAEGKGRQSGATAGENLAETDFRHLTDPEELAAAHDLAERLARSMRARLTRRDQARRSGHRLDLRRTIHRNIGHGGEPIERVMRRRKPKALRIVVLLDASGSMSLYSAVFVRFLHGLIDTFREAEAFVFHTRLVHISEALKEKDPVRAIDRLSLMAQGWNGGTKIGESLRDFNKWHASRVIHSRTAVIIVSDGYDTGKAEELGAEMAALRRRCRRIAWLNPMIGWDGYSPEAQGMQAALPFLDLFAPAHNLKSLEALEPYLARL
jgi:uncharacterized protein